MRLLCILILTLATGLITRAEPPLHLSAYTVQRDGVGQASLVVVVFVDAPARVTTRVALPAGWSGASDWSGVVSRPQLLTYQLTADVNAVPGLGTIVVQASDDRGHTATGRAWVRAPGEVARAPVGARVWLAAVRR